MRFFEKEGRLLFFLDVSALSIERSPTRWGNLLPSIPWAIPVADELRLGSKVENEIRAQLPSKQGTSPEQTSALEESIYKLSGQLSTINRMQKYFRTRENRNFSTVKSTEGRIFNFSVVESGLMVCMAGLQVFIVKFFFQGARKGMFFVLQFFSFPSPITSSSSSQKFPFLSFITFPLRLVSKFSIYSIF